MDTINTHRRGSALLEPICEILIVVSLVTGILAALIHVEMIPMESDDGSPGANSPGAMRVLNPVRWACLTPDGLTLVSFGIESAVVMRDLAHGGGPANRFAAPAGCEQVCGVAVSHDGRMLLAGYAHGEAALWPDFRVSTDAVVLDGHRGEVFAAGFSPDDQLALTGSSDGTIQLWDVRRRERRYRISAHSHGVRCLRFLPDGRRFLSAGNDGRLALWETETGKLLRNFGGHTWVVVAIALSRDSRQIASASLDGTVRVWDLESGCELWRADDEKAASRSVAFTPDGESVLCGGMDGEIVVRSGKTGKMLTHLAGHTRTVRSLQFFPDGRHFLSAGYDGTVRRWDFAMQREVRQMIHSESAAETR